MLYVYLVRSACTRTTITSNYTTVTIIRINTSSYPGVFSHYINDQNWSLLLQGIQTIFDLDKGQCNTSGRYVTISSLRNETYGRYVCVLWLLWCEIEQMGIINDSRPGKIEQILSWPYITVKIDHSLLFSFSRSFHLFKEQWLTCDESCIYVWHTRKCHIFMFRSSLGNDRECHVSFDPWSCSVKKMKK